MAEYIQRLILSLLFFISSFASSILSAFHHQTQIVVPLPDTTTARISEIVPTPPNAPGTNTEQAEGTSSSSPLALFRTYDITFSYPSQAGAVWVDLSTESHFNATEYHYRFPYDPEKDSDVDTRGIIGISSFHRAA